jgi:signal transduction histidine kinase
VPTQPTATVRAKRRAPGGWTLVDLAVSLVVLVLLVGEVLPNPEMTPREPLLLLAVLMGTAMAWRTSHPATVAIVVAAANLGMSLVSTGPFAPQLAIVPLLLVLFEAASRTRGRVALVTGATTLVLTVASWLVTEEGRADDFWPWLLWAGAWLTGTFVRRRSDLAAHHAARAALMEVEARSAAAESTQQERDRIARELHDVVAHSVSVMVVQAGAERLRLGEDGGRTAQVLGDIEDVGRAALAELRGMLGVMRGPAGEELAPLPTLSDLPALVQRVRAAGPTTELVCEPSGLLAGEQPADAAVGLAAYRIVQEALTNVVRHAGAVDTEVRLELRGTSLVVSVRNASPLVSDRVANAASSGRGLLGMRERVTALGGSFRAAPSPEGFEVHAVLPLRVGVTAS